MNQDGSAIALTVLGALLGAVLSPAIEQMFRGKSSVASEQFSAARGLTLLCSANATWLVSMIVFQSSSQSIAGVLVTLLLYLLTVVFFIGSYTQFLHAGDSSHNNWSIFVVPLLLGNALWVIGEGAEGVLRLLNRDEFPMLGIKYVFYMLSVASFLWGVITYFRRGDGGKNA